MTQKKYFEVSYYFLSTTSGNKAQWQLTLTKSLYSEIFQGFNPETIETYFEINRQSPFVHTI